ncbi:MAG: hypothetical protein P8168_05540 [Deltaproteobacteria bacterium]
MIQGGLTTPQRQGFVCLLTFLAYLLLPLAHQWELAAQARGWACPSHLAGETVGLDLLSLPPAPGQSRHPHHDRSTCPLCQAALGLVKLAITAGAAVCPAAQFWPQVRIPAPLIFLPCETCSLFGRRAPPRPS